MIPYGAALTLERAALDSLRDAPAGAACWHIWRTEKCVIVPRGLPSRDYFARAADAVRACGYPVHERDTGGDLTPQEPGVVNFSYCFRLDGADAAIADAYRRLAAPVTGFLRDSFGLVPHLASIPGAFCDGAFNIAIGGRKLAGTAQRWKLLGGEGAARRVAVLGHVALMVSNDLPPAIAALNAFYAASGSDRRIVPERHVTLADLIGPEAADADRIAAAFADYLAQNAAHGDAPSGERLEPHR